MPVGLTNLSSLSSLSFLAPIPGLVAVGVCVPSLIALYILKLKRRPVRISSTMLWEQALKDLEVNTPFRKFRASWLFLLQLLAILLLCGAIARPALNTTTPPPARTIIVIDRSASMNATDGEADSTTQITRLDAAKQAASSRARELASSGAQVMVIAFAQEPQTVIDFSSDAGALQAAINAITPTDQPDNVEQALKVIRARTSAITASNAFDETSLPSVVLYSDGGLNLQRGADLSVGPASFSYVRTGPAQASDKDNLAIAALSARRSPDDPAQVRLFVRVTSASTSTTPTTAALVASLDGEPFNVQTLDMPTATQGITSEATRTLDVTAPLGGLLTVRVQHDDLYQQDNRASLILTPPAPVRVLLVRPAINPDEINPDQQAQSTQAADFAITDALTSVPGVEITQLREDVFLERIASPATTPYAGVSLVMFDRVSPPVVPPVPSVSFAGAPPLEGVTLEQQREPNTAWQAVTFWQRTNPLMRYVTLDTTRFTTTQQLSLPETATILARTNTGPLIASIQDDAALTHVVIAAPLASTNWWREVSFPVFMTNAVDTLAHTLAQSLGPNAAGQAFSTAQPAVARLSSRTVQRTTSEAILFIGENAARTVRVGPTGTAQLGVVERAGIHAVRSGNTQFPIAINITDAHESALATRDQLIIAGRVTQAGTTQTQAPKEIWWWLVLAALIVTSTEWLWFAKQMRVPHMRQA